MIGTSPASKRSRVDLPQPLGPMIATKSPSLAMKFMSCNTVGPSPNFFTTASNCTEQALAVTSDTGQELLQVSPHHGTQFVFRQSGGLNLADYAINRGVFAVTRMEPQGIVAPE